MTKDKCIKGVELIMSGSLDLGSLILRVTANTDSAQKGLNSVADQAERVVSKFDNLNRVGQSLSSIGATLTKTLTVPLVALGTTVAKLGTDFEYSMAKVQAITGATGAEFEKLENLARDIGANTQFSAREAAEGMTYLAMAGWDTNQMLAGYESIVQLSIATTTDLARCSDIVTDALTAMGYSAEDTGHFCDVLAKAAMNSNTNVDMMGESFTYVASIAGTLGYSVEDLAVALGILANAGIKSSQAGTTLRKILTNLASPTDEAAALMEQYGISMFDSEGNARDLGDVLTDLRKAFSGLTEEEKAQAAETIAGTQALSGFMALINASDEDFAKLTQEINNADGATKEMADTMAKTTQGKIKAMISALEECALQLADILLPAIQKVVEWITNMAKKFQSLSPAAKEAIVKFAALAAAIGPVLSIGGKLITLCSGIVSAFSAAAGAGSVLGGAIALLSSVTVPLIAILGTLAVAAAGVVTYNEAMSKTTLDAADDMNIFEKAILKAQGATLRSKEELQDLGLVYEDFNENISPEFQQVVEAMTDDIHDFNLSLNDLNLDGVITEDESNKLGERVKKAVENCKKIVDEQVEGINESLSSVFARDGQIDQDEQALLDYWTQVGETEKAEVQRLEDEITQIREKARTEGRALTPEEIQAIQDYYTQIKLIELQCQANNQYELEYSRSEFHQRIDKMDGEHAIKALEERAKNFEDENIQTNAHYDGLIAEVKNLCTDKNGVLSEEGKRTIEILEGQRQEELETNKKAYDEDEQYVMDHCENLGIIWNKYRKEQVQAVDEANYKEFEQYMEHYDGLNKVTESGYKRMYNTSTGTWDDLYVHVNEKTGELDGVYDLNSQNVATMTKEEESNLRDNKAAWDQTSAGVLANCITMGTAYSDLSGNIRDESGNVIGHIRKVEDENGNLKDTIVDLNGNPIDIGDNSGEVIQNLRNTARQVDDVDGKEATVTITTNHVDNYIQKYNNQGPGATMYADGTDSAARGLAMVGEAGPELIMSRSGQAMLANSATLMNMAGGEKVYTATETARIFKNMEKLSNFLAMQSAAASYRGASKSDIREVVNEILDVASVGSDRPINVALNLDSKVLAKTMVKPIEREIGRVQKGRSYNRGASSLT